MKIPLFDIDGTILKHGSIRSHYEAFEYAFKEVYGIVASSEEINSIGKIDNQIIIEVLELHGFSDIQVKEKLSLATKTMAEYFSQHKQNDTYIVLPGVKKLLKILKQKNIPIGLLTGNVEKIGWGKMEMAGVRDYFDFGAFGNFGFKRVELIKIAGERARKLAHLQMKDNDFVIIGDAPPDIECAQQGNIQVIAVASGKYTFQELEQYKPDLLLNSLEETEKVLSFLEVK